MSLRVGRRLLRGKMDVEPWMGVSCYPVGPHVVGGVASVRPGYDHLRDMRPQRPLRAIGIDRVLPPVLYNPMDQVILIENALALQRVESQVSCTLSQLALGIRNADNFLDHHLLHQEVRPSVYTIWFHDDGLRAHQHILSNLAAHHLVPLFSLIGYDVERGKMTTLEATELYEELMDCSVAQPEVVRRELANQMIRVHCLDENFDAAVDVIDEMRAKQIRRTFVSYAPLFRMVRSRLDAERHMKLLEHMYEVEGGKLSKFLYIDLPRMMYMFGVFIRYNWAAINISFTVISTVLLLNYLNFGINN